MSIEALTSRGMAAQVDDAMKQRQAEASRRTDDNAHGQPTADRVDISEEGRAKAAAMVLLGMRTRKT